MKILSCRCAGSLQEFGSRAQFLLTVGSLFSLEHLPQLPGKFTLNSIALLLLPSCTQCKLGYNKFILIFIFERTLLCLFDHWNGMRGIFTSYVFLLSLCRGAVWPECVHPPHKWEHTCGGHMCAGTLRVWCKAVFVNSKSAYFFMCRLALKQVQ